MDISKKLILIGFGLGAVFWIIEALLEVFVFHHSSNFSYYLFPPDTHLIWHRLIVIILLIIFVVLSLLTILKHRKSVEVLKKERDKAQQYLDIAGVMFVVIDSDQKVSLINKKGCEVLGYKDHEIIGKNWFDNFLPERNRQDVKAVFVKLMAGDIEPVEYYVNSVLNRSGEERIIAWHNTVLRGEAGNIIYTLGSGEDVTERKKAEEGLKNRTYELGKRVKELNCLYNISKLIEKENLQLEEIIQGIVNLIPPAWQYPEVTCARINIKHQTFKTDNFKETLWKLSADIISYGNKVGIVEVFYLEEKLKIDGGPFLKEERNLIHALSEMISTTVERIESRKLLNQSKKNWENTFNTITDMITIHDNDFNIILANKAAEKILGLPFLEVTKGKCYKYYHGTDKPPRGCPSCTCLKTGKPASFELFEPHLNMFIEIRAIPRFDNNNQFIGLIHVVRDMTERKKIEEELIRSQKLSSLGKMLTGISHEVKNPLAGIGMILRTVADGFSEQDSCYKDIKKILNEIKRLENLLNNLVNFSKPKPLILNKTDIIEPVENSIHLLTRDIKNKGIIVKSIYHHNGVKIPIDSAKMQQVFLNLFINAVKAMDENGVLNISTYEIKNGQIYGSEPVYPDLEESIQAEMNSGIQVLIKDSGHGIKKENLGRIFDPFYSSEPSNAGLGLYITHEIVREHKGSINVSSTEGIGTTFRIILPNLTETAGSHAGTKNGI